MENITTALTMVHPEQAERWLMQNNFVRQRSLRNWHVRYLSQAMRAGRFLEGTQIHFVLYKGTRHLINGQHTLAAIVQAQIPIVLNVQETTVTSEGDIAVLYGRHDRGLSRSLGDSYHAHGFAEISGLSKLQSNDLGGAMPMTLSGFTQSGGRMTTLGILFKDQDLRYQMMLNWLSEGQAFFDDISGTAGFLHKALTRQAVMSIALVTYRHTGADAGDFWREVAKDNGLQTDNPAKTLIRFLLNTPAIRHSPPLYARYVASTWNAFFTERSLSRVYVRDMSLPLLLEGTPHTHECIMRYITPEGDILQQPMPFAPDDTPPSATVKSNFREGTPLG